jgi:hypothetical protein
LFYTFEEIRAFKDEARFERRMARRMARRNSTGGLAPTMSAAWIDTTAVTPCSSSTAPVASDAAFGFDSATPFVFRTTDDIAVGNPHPQTRVQRRGSVA